MKNLGVTFDICLKVDIQVCSVVKASFFQLHLLAKVKPFLSQQDLERAILAFISSRLDHCNVTGLPKSLISRFNVSRTLQTHFNRHIWT